MNCKLRATATGLCIFTLILISAATAFAQTANEVKEKPPMYSYVGNWAIPRAQWADMDKAAAADEPILNKAIASGTLVGYGNDVNLVHTGDTQTHDDWWSAMSMAGVVNILDQFYKSGNSVTPVLTSATKHWDNIYVSRYYNWKPGTYKNVYTHGGIYKLKPNAPDDAVETISKTMVVPLLEKQLAAGNIVEYEVDEEAIHTEAPDTFSIIYIAANSEALDKVSAAVREAFKASPLMGPTFDSMTDYTGHRDFLARTNAVYK